MAQFSVLVGWNKPETLITPSWDTRQDAPRDSGGDYSVETKQAFKDAIEKQDLDALFRMDKECEKIWRDEE